MSSLSCLLKLMAHILDHFLLFWEFSFPSFWLFVNALHGIFIKITFLIQLFDDLLSFWNCITFNIKLSTEFIKMRFQLKVLFIFLVQFFDEVLLYKLQVLLSLLIFKYLPVQWINLTMHILFESRCLCLLVLGDIVKMLHVRLVVCWLGDKSTFTISDHLTQFKLLGMENVKLILEVVKRVFKTLSLIKNTGYTEVLGF